MSDTARELTPDEIVADIEAMKPRKRKVTIYQSWPRMILERERKRALAAALAEVRTVVTELYLDQNRSFRYDEVDRAILDALAVPKVTLPAATRPKGCLACGSQSHD